MNKTDLVEKVAAESNLTKVDTTRVIDRVFETIADTLKEGGEVRIAGFGTFGVAKKAATKGRNPRTGEEIHIPESMRAKFSVSKALKESLNS